MVLYLWVQEGLRDLCHSESPSVFGILEVNTEMMPALPEMVPLRYGDTPAPVGGMLLKAEMIRNKEIQQTALLRQKPAEHLL